MESCQEEPTMVGRRSLTVQLSLRQFRSLGCGTARPGAKFKPLLGPHGQFERFSSAILVFMWIFLTFPSPLSVVPVEDQTDGGSVSPALSWGTQNDRDHYLLHQHAEMKLIFKNHPMIKIKSAFLAVMHHIFFILARISQQTDLKRGITSVVCVFYRNLDAMLPYL